MVARGAPTVPNCADISTEDSRPEVPQWAHSERCPRSPPSSERYPACGPRPDPANRRDSGAGTPVPPRIVLVVDNRVSLDNIEWNDVVDQLASLGWSRLVRAVDSHQLLEALERAAPGPWSSLPGTEGSAGVRQAGLTAHSDVDDAADVVRSLADEIKAGIDSADDAVAPLPAFNHAEWCGAERGEKFITPHRDPEAAGGVIAVLTIRGRAVFRIWEFTGPLADAQAHPELATAWESEDGDLVLMRGGGWPLPDSRCPIHEAESPLERDRITLTLRHNKGGYGADYFS